VLAGQRRRAKLPIDFAGRPADHDHGRDVAEAQQDVAWGGFRSLDKSRPIKPAPALATASNGLPVSASRVGARSTWEDTAFVLLPPG
jgi:hypothetical protein